MMAIRSGLKLLDTEGLDRMMNVMCALEEELDDYLLTTCSYGDGMTQHRSLSPQVSIKAVYVSGNSRSSDLQAVLKCIPPPHSRPNYSRFVFFW